MSPYYFDAAWFWKSEVYVDLWLVWSACDGYLDLVSSGLGCHCFVYVAVEILSCEHGDLCDRKPCEPCESLGAPLAMVTAASLAPFLHFRL